MTRAVSRRPLPRPTSAAARSLTARSLTARSLTSRSLTSRSLTSRSLTSDPAIAHRRRRLGRARLEAAHLTAHLSPCRRCDHAAGPCRGEGCCRESSRASLSAADHAAPQRAGCRRRRRRRIRRRLTWLPARGVQGPAAAASRRSGQWRWQHRSTIGVPAWRDSRGRRRYRREPQRGLRRGRRGPMEVAAAASSYRGRCCRWSALRLMRSALRLMRSALRLMRLRRCRPSANREWNHRRQAPGRASRQRSWRQSWGWRRGGAARWWRRQ